VGSAPGCGKPTLPTGSFWLPYGEMGEGMAMYSLPDIVRLDVAGLGTALEKRYSRTYGIDYHNESEIVQRRQRGLSMLGIVDGERWVFYSNSLWTMQSQKSYFLNTS